MEVQKVVNLLFSYLKIEKKISTQKGIFSEANLLKLNSSKAITKLRLKNKWNMKKSIKETAKWYKSFLEKEDVKKISISQIKEYFNLK